MKYFALITTLSPLLFLLGSTHMVSAQQQKDSVKITELKKVVVLSYINMYGIGHLKEVLPPIIYAGKKTEVIIVDSVDANKPLTIRVRYWEGCPD
ncbi:MAG: hypothetical protein ABIN89_16620 [Chitinophagaceae bacterium]